MSTPPSRKVKRLLVAGGLEENWYNVLAGAKISLPDGEYDVEVEQASWEDLSCVSYSDSGIDCQLNAALKPITDKQKTIRRFVPDFVFYRGLCRTIGSRSGRTPDYRNILYGFVHANVPMFNSYESIQTELDRPIMYSVLRRINKRLGQDKFPIIPQHYYPDHSEFLITPDLPFVAKVSYPHAGYGKMVVKSSEQRDDLKSLLSLHNDYCVCEPFITRKSECRIVSIGSYSRAHKRDAFQWKVNAGGNERSDTPMTDQYKLWVSELRKELPGMTYFSIDSIEDEDGKEFILEFNGSTTGLPPEHSVEYYSEIRKALLDKMTEAFSVPVGLLGKVPLLLGPEEAKGAFDPAQLYDLKLMEEELHRTRTLNDSLKARQKQLSQEVSSLMPAYRKKKGLNMFAIALRGVFFSLFIYLAIFYFQNKRK